MTRAQSSHGANLGRPDTATEHVARAPRRAAIVVAAIVAAATLAACSAAETVNTATVTTEDTPAIEPDPESQPEASDTTDSAEPDPAVELVLVNPAKTSSVTRKTEITIRVEATKGATVTVNGKPAKRRGDGSYARTIPLKTGKNKVEVIARMEGYTEAAAQLTIKRELSAAEIAAREAKREEAFKAVAKTIAYGELIKDPDRYAGKKVKYYGEILQIQESGGVGFMLLYVTDLGYDVWTDQVWVDYVGHVKGVEGSKLTVYGLVTGTKSYETQIGGETYVPEVLAVYIDE